MDTEYERLKKRVEDKQVLLDQEREMKKKRPNERMMENDSKPDRLDEYSFWCDVCEMDFSAPCYKTVHRLYGYPIGIYRSRCPDCETPAIRHITHRDEDLFYQKSTKIRIQRNQYAWETLQAQDYGFRTIYGDPYAGFNEVQEIKEETRVRKRQELGFREIFI